MKDLISIVILNHKKGFSAIARFEDTKKDFILSAPKIEYLYNNIEDKIRRM